jgi:hypothetical protein
VYEGQETPSQRGVNTGLLSSRKGFNVKQVIRHGESSDTDYVAIIAKITNKFFLNIND